MSLQQKWIDYRLNKSRIKKKLWSKEKEIISDAEEIKKEKYELTKSSKKISTTKAIVAFMLINCTVIEIYALWAMYKLQDLSPLSLLVTSVVGEVLSFAIYAVKAAKENTVGGISYLNAENELGRSPSDDDLRG